MIRSLLKASATVATLPLWIAGNALMVPILKRRLEREKERADEVQRKLNMANATVYQQIEALRDRDAEIEIEHTKNARRLERARRLLRVKTGEQWDDALARFIAEQRAMERGRAKEAAQLRAELDAERHRRYEHAQGQIESALAVYQRGLAAALGVEDRSLPRLWDLIARVREGRERAAADLARAQAEHGHLLDGTVSNAVYAEMRARLAEVEAAHDGAATEYHTLAGRLEALRSAVGDQIADCAQAARDGLAGWFVATNMSDALERALTAATPPVQDTQLRVAAANREKSNDIHACAVAARRTDDLASRGRNARPPIEGDHPADDPVTQQWAGVVEDLQRKRDEDTRRLEAAWRERDALRFEVDRLRKEQGDTDRDHDAAVAELKARHREVLAERDQRITGLRADMARLRRAVQ